MRCAICDSDSDTVTPTADCAVCQEAIAECLAGYPKLAEDEDFAEAVDPEYDETMEWISMELPIASFD